jgi:hypothetical protein
VADADDDLREQFNRWQFEYALLDTVLRQIEQEEQNILTACEVSPPTPVEAFAVLNGERPEPSAGPRTRRDLAQVHEAYTILTLIQQTRGHLELGHGNPRLAAYKALLVGLGASAATARKALRVVQQQQGKKGGAARGRDISDQAAKDDAEIRRLYQQWASSVRLQELHRSATAYIAKKTGLNYHKVHRRRERLNLQ